MYSGQLRKKDLQTKIAENNINQNKHRKQNSKGENPPVSIVQIKLPNKTHFS